MTSLVTWIGVDSRGPASIYIASDSRITWGKCLTWDYGRKVFASQKHPIIIGYVGDVLFPSQILGQIINLIDSNLFCNKDEQPEIQAERITHIIIQSFEAYPISERRNFEVVYCARKDEGMASIFYIFSIGWESKTDWYLEKLELPDKSGIIRLLGTGKKPLGKWHERWNNIETEKSTSRAVFSAFCDALQSNEDKYSGGAPQLVGLYRIGAGQSIGTIYKGKRYLYGLPIFESMLLQNIEWRNSIFERCDWRTMEKLNNAHKHRRPKGLANA
jgi:hypothetical protein